HRRWAVRGDRARNPLLVLALAVLAYLTHWAVRVHGTGHLLRLLVLALAFLAHLTHWTVGVHGAREFFLLDLADAVLALPTPVAGVGRAAGRADPDRRSRRAGIFAATAEDEGKYEEQSGEQRKPEGCVETILIWVLKGGLHDPGPVHPSCLPWASCIRGIARLEAYEPCTPSEVCATVRRGRATSGPRAPPRRGAAAALRYARACGRRAPPNRKVDRARTARGG